MPLASQRSRDAAAAVAAQRLSSSRPLYAVSLRVALSQLLQPCSLCQSDTLASSVTKVSSGASQPTHTDVASDFESQLNDPLTEAVEAQSAETTRLSAEPQEASDHKTQWLTRHFVAQVRAHFEAALGSSSPADGQQEAGSGEDEGNESSGEAEERLKYQRALCQAALYWAIALLLSAECFLFPPPTKQPAAQTPADCSHHPSKSSGSSSGPSVPDSDATDRCKVESVSADDVVRGKPFSNDFALTTALSLYELLKRGACFHGQILRLLCWSAEALFALDILIRVSPSIATHMLPKILAWLDERLSFRLKWESSCSSRTGDGIGQECSASAAQTSSSVGDTLEHAIERIASGPLSSLVRCNLPNWVASGRLCSSSQHLQQTRLLALLLRCPKVLVSSSRLLAACALPAKAAADGASGGAQGSVRGTAPKPSQEGKDAKAAAEAEASVQHQICAETARQLLVALDDLRDVLIPNAAKKNIHNASSSTQGEQVDFRFGSEVEKMILAAHLPPHLRWVASSSQHTSARSQEVAERPAENSCCWAFAAPDFPAPEGAPNKAAVYIYATVKVGSSARLRVAQEMEKCVWNAGYSYDITYSANYQSAIDC